MIAFTIPGAAHGKGRPRFAKRGNFVKTYTDEKTASYENLVKLAAQSAMNGRQLYQEAISAAIVVSVMVPASWSQKKRAAALSGDLRPMSKPDLDNVAKSILDACNGIVYLDDKQVVELLVVKRYAEEPRAEVRLMIAREASVHSMNDLLMSS